MFNLVQIFIGCCLNFDLDFDYAPSVIKAWDQDISVDYTVEWCDQTMKHAKVLLPGSRLNIKTVLSTYGDFHVKHS